MSISPLLSAKNRRASPRKMIRGDATIVVGDATKVAQTWDLGREGMCLVSARPIAPGTRCRVSFEVPFAAERIAVTLAAKVVYSSYSAAGEFKIGAVFTDLDDDAVRLLGRFSAAD